MMLLLATGLFGQPEGQFERPISQTDAVYGFVEYLPSNYHDDDNHFPLIVYLHGRGEVGDGEADLWKVKSNGPHRLIDEGTDFQAVILAPQSVSDWDLDSLDYFVEWAFERYKVDTTRLYITGISMGGAGVWLYATRFPKKVAAIVPISGDTRAKNPEKLADVPVWAFHNEGDQVVEVELTHDWINGIIAAGGNPKVTIYDDSTHDAWTRTYENQELWDWLFTQHLEVEHLPLGLEPSAMVVYPNPFTDQINLTRTEVTEARLFGLDGQLVFEWPRVMPEGQMTILPISISLRPGIYLLELTSPLGKERFRVVRE